MAQKNDCVAVEYWMPHCVLERSRHSYGQVPSVTAVQLLRLPW